MEELPMKLTCCFCGDQIVRTAVDPLIIDMRSEGADEESREDTQSFYCHAACFESRLYSQMVPFRWFSDSPPVNKTKT